MLSRLMLPVKFVCTKQSVVKSLRGVKSNGTKISVINQECLNLEAQRLPD